MPSHLSLVGPAKADNPDTTRNYQITENVQASLQITHSQFSDLSAANLCTQISCLEIELLCPLKG
jgi:hypothetical protein